MPLPRAMYESTRYKKYDGCFFLCRYEMAVQALFWEQNIYCI